MPRVTRSHAAHNLRQSSLVGGPKGLGDFSEAESGCKDGKEKGARSSMYNVAALVEERPVQWTR